MKRSLFLAATASAAAVAALPMPAAPIAANVTATVTVEAEPMIWMVGYRWYVARSKDEALAFHVEHMLEYDYWYRRDGDDAVCYDYGEPVDLARIVAYPETGALVKRDDGTLVECMEMYYDGDDPPSYTARYDESEGIAYVPFEEMIAENGLGHLCDEA